MSEAILYYQVCFHGTEREIFKWQDLWHTYRTLRPVEILYLTLKDNKLVTVDATLVITLVPNFVQDICI